MKVFRKIFLSFICSYAVLVTVLPLVVNDLDHWSTVRYSCYIACGVVIGVLIEMLLSIGRNNNDAPKEEVHPEIPEEEN